MALFLCSTREEFWNRALEGGIHVLDPEHTDYPDMPTLRAAAYREATARGLKVSTSQTDNRHLVIAPYGGPQNWAPVPKERFRSLISHFKVDPNEDSTIRMTGFRPAAGTMPPGAEKNLPSLDPAGSLFVNPGAFWENRTWLPAAEWHCPFGMGKPNPLQCTWFPYKELWELRELSLLQDRREAGTLFPWEQRKGYMPPGTELADAGGWVWTPEDWGDLASERAHCNCHMRTDGSLVSPDNKRDHPPGCFYWEAPMPEDDVAAIIPFMDPRAARVPGLMDEAEARIKVLESQDPDRAVKDGERRNKLARKARREQERAQGITWTLGHE